MTFVPKPAIEPATADFAPSPTDNMVMTAATPMIMPSMVRAVRSLLRASDLNAIRKSAQKIMSGFRPRFLRFYGARGHIVLERALIDGQRG